MNVVSPVQRRPRQGSGTNVGGFGQGPGEYTYPMVGAIGPNGRIFVLDVRSRRVNVYGVDGEPLETWFMPRVACCAWPLFPRPDGSAWVPVDDFNRETRETRHGVQAWGPDGEVGDVLWLPEIELQAITYHFDGRDFDVPFGPGIRWGPLPNGDAFIGATDRYRFEIHRRDGSVLIVERYEQPVPIDPQHREWQRRATIARRRFRGAPGWSWRGDEIPTHFMPYATIVPALSGELWVGRYTGSRWLGDCTEDPLQAGESEQSVTQCWGYEWTIDVFDADGRFLGEVEAPPDILPYPLGLSIDGDVAVGNVRDDAGTTRVKRYRLERPPEEGS